jgi:hypothetical protein
MASPGIRTTETFSPPLLAVTNEPGGQMGNGTVCPASATPSRRSKRRSPAMNRL